MCLRFLRCVKQGRAGGTERHKREKSDDGRKRLRDLKPFHSARHIVARTTVCEGRALGRLSAPPPFSPGWKLFCEPSFSSVRPSSAGGSQFRNDRRRRRHFSLGSLLCPRFGFGRRGLHIRTKGGPKFRDRLTKKHG